MKNKTLIAITAISAAILSAAVTSFFLIDKQADVFISKIPDIIGIKTTEGGKENKAVSCVRGDSTQTEFGELSLKHTGENLLGAGREKFYLNGMPLPNSISSADFDEYLNFKGGTAILLDWGNGGDCIGCNGTIPAVLTKYGLSIYNGRNFIFGFNKIIALKNNSEVAFVYAYNNGRKYRLLYKNNKFTLQELPKVYNRTKMDKDCKSAYNIYKGCSNGLPNVGLSFIDQYHAEYNWNNSFFFKNCSTSDYLKLSYSKFSKFYCTYDKNNRNQLETSSQAKAENEAVLKATKAAEAAAARQAAAERAAKLKKQLAEQAAKAAQEARAKALEEQLEAQAKAQAEANLAAAQKREHAASTNSSDQLIISYHGRTFIGKNIAGFGIYVISAENKNGFVTARVCYQNLSRTPHSVGYNNFALLSNIKDLYYPENPYSNNPYPGFVSLGVPKELNPLLTKCGSLYFSVPDNYSEWQPRLRSSSDPGSRICGTFCATGGSIL